MYSVNLIGDVGFETRVPKVHALTLETLFLEDVAALLVGEKREQKLCPLSFRCEASTLCGSACPSGRRVPCMAPLNRKSVEQKLW